MDLLINTGDFEGYEQHITRFRTEPVIGHYVYIRFYNKSEGIADWFLENIDEESVTYYEVVNVAISNDPYMLRELLAIIPPRVMEELRERGVRLPTSEETTDILESHDIPTLLATMDTYTRLIEETGRVPDGKTLTEAVSEGNIDVVLSLMEVGILPSEDDLELAVENNDIEMVRAIEEEYEVMGIRGDHHASR